MHAGHIASQFHDVAAWMAGPDARAAARAETTRLRLPSDLVDDLLQETLCGLWRTFTRRREPYEEFDAAAFARRSLRHAALNMLRAEAARPDAPTPEAVQPVENVADDTDIESSVASFMSRASRESAMRTTLFAGIDTDPETGSAALTTLTLILHPEVTPGPGTPLPTGSHTADPAFWAGLWYAGRSDCFEGHDSATPVTVRKRRTRAISKVKSALAAAISFQASLEAPDG